MSNLKASVFREICHAIFNFFLDRQKDHNLPHYHINLPAKRGFSFYFTAMFRVWCLQFTNQNKKWSVETFLLLAGLKKWPTMQEHVNVFR